MILKCTISGRPVACPIHLIPTVLPILFHCSLAVPQKIQGTRSLLMFSAVIESNP